MACQADGLTAQMLSNLELLFRKLDTVREFIGRPIVVHVAWRSVPYNALVKGAHDSSHLALEDGVAAVDFHVSGILCLQAREAFLPMLETWGMRMEDNGPHGNWIHLDTRSVPVGGHRFFIP